MQLAKFSLLAAVSCWSTAAQPAGVIEQLQQQYVPSALYDETSSVVTQAGIILTVRRPAISANPAIGGTYTQNFYAPHAGSVTQQKPSGRRGAKRLPFIDSLIVGEKVYVTNIEATDDTVTLDVQTCLPSVQHASFQLVYRAAVTFSFPAEYVSSANIGGIEETIGEVFSIAVPAPAQLSGLFVNSRNDADRLELNRNGSFSLTEAGRSLTGRFSVHDNQLVLMIAETETSAIAAVREGKIIDAGGQVWVQRGSSGDVVSSPPHPSQHGGGADIVHVGQTTDEVKGLLGPPDKIDNANGKMVYVYTGLKVTFAGGKVVGVE
jgi:hypothetical protein